MTGWLKIRCDLYIYIHYNQEICTTKTVDIRIYKTKIYCRLNYNYVVFNGAFLKAYQSQDNNIGSLNIIITKYQEVIVKLHFSIW